MPAALLRQRVDDANASRELSWRRVVGLWHAWELEVSVATDAWASVCWVSAVPVVLFITRRVQNGRPVIAVCVLLSMVALLAHLVVVLRHREWYNKKRTRVIVALRVVIFLTSTATWALSDWSLSRPQEIATRGLFGLFLSLGYTLSGNTQFALQCATFLALRLVLFASAPKRWADEQYQQTTESTVCSPLGICHRFIDGVSTGHSRMWGGDEDFGELTSSRKVPFAYSARGLFFDFALVVVFPALVNYLQRRVRLVVFSDETQARRRRESNESEEREAEREYPGSVVQQVWRGFQVLVPLMEFPDDQLEKRFRDWHARAMTKVDTTRAAISTFTSLLWYNKITSMIAKRGVVIVRLAFFKRLCVAAFTSHCVNLYLVSRHTDWYVKHRTKITTAVRTQMVSMYLLLWYFMAGLNCAISRHTILANPDSAPAGVAETLLLWMTTHTWFVPRVGNDSFYVAEINPPADGSALDENFVTNSLLVFAFDLRLVHFVMQIAGTHQLMRTSLCFTVLYVAFVCVLEPMVASSPPPHVWPSRVTFLPFFNPRIARQTSVWLDGTCVVAVGYFMERYFRNAFAKAINLEMRQTVFMRSPLARLWLMTETAVPPRPTPATEDAHDAAAAAAGEPAAAAVSVRRRQRITQRT
jgi:hypothetical protein